MNLKTILTLTVIATLIILSAGCIDNESIQTPEVNDPYVFVDQTPRIPAEAPTPYYIPTPKLTPKKLNQIEIIIKNNIPYHEYKINTKLGSEVYVCSHYGCDMAQNLINSGYNAGVVIDHNANHALTWLNLSDTYYVIEPQTGKYWLKNKYEPYHNIDYVSLSKGKEHAKCSSEGLHR